MSRPPIQISDHDWSVLQEVLRGHLPDAEVWAFGSRARGTAKPYSDLDLAVVLAAPLSLVGLADLNHALEESDMTIRVDIVDWASASEAFRRVIEADRVRIRP